MPRLMKKQTSTATILVLTFGASTFAQQLPFTRAGTAQAPASAQAMTAAADNPAPPPEQDVIQKLLDGKIPDTLSQGKFDLDVRLRVEFADEDGLKTIKSDSAAPTVRTRFGYTTAPLYGFQAMLQGQNTSVLGPEDNYNAAGSNGQGHKPVVSDPAVTDLDQGWLAYAYTNIFDVKAGRQRMVLDNQRFVGDVDWRQNIQTFDAATLHLQPIDHLDFLYSYLWDVHRIYGNVSGLPPANQDYSSDSHLVNVSYSGWEYGRFVGYTYLLGLTNGAGGNNSCATYGGYFAGAAPVNDTISLDYRAEYAWQTDYGQSALRYQAGYWNLELGANLRPFAWGAGCETLGSGENSGKSGGRTSFRTPLATLHSFDGSAEAFLTPPSAGLRDIYGYAQVILPAQIPLRFIYHKFDADYGGGNYGQEFDLIATKNFGRHWQVLLAYAYYNGADAAPPSLTVAHVDLQRAWAQVEFSF